MEYIVTFFTHFGAIKYSRFLSGKGIPSETMPVPRKLSSSCGVCVKFRASEEISSMVSDDIERIFLLEGSEAKLIYDNK
ncbi:MAG: DUF3343 domain-containing protein [Lutispora sp.]|uniref:DUF3343 domain-containing protein n=1 Tax=Lutispora saccharofermentans TaxID=3024236 RepID=A0ABT1NE94_9FIRM|nr:DUF3343 domain-containing protein [Lutispora saccharofermentans]MCQ1529587.1 DUF3343 domain-containing protein [Lutispora saccharofermentans]MEA4962428.1 DUF3343 domain-containing protein [Lutispora sp.]